MSQNYATTRQVIVPDKLPINEDNGRVYQKPRDADEYEVGVNIPGGSN